MKDVATPDIWIVLVCLAAGSFALRFIFLGIVGDRAMPPWVLRHLRYTAVAVLPALVAPMVAWPPATGGALDAPRMLAAAATLIAGIVTRNVLAAILSGGVTLYLMLYLLG
ncbi:AzlD domain-containing protein [Phaeovulum sp.]|uniref:AzlD domain-containing protein n=1 Tax=Phaeovulum sp. TaxID=2934796 RepID=UPI0039E5E5EB